MVPYSILLNVEKFSKNHLAANFKKVSWLGAEVRGPAAGLGQGMQNWSGKVRFS